jgi:Family of unknown function (DUF5985)
MTIAETIYALCAVTSLIAAILLWRQYRVTRTRLLFWSFVGFSGLALNNVLVFVDLVLVPTTDLALVRTLAGLAGLTALLYGLIWETQR